MSMALTKETLIKEFLSVKGSYGSVTVANLSHATKVEYIMDRMAQYLARKGTDAEVNSMRYALDAVLECYHTNYMEECIKLSRRIFGRLAKKKKWSFLDIRILSYVICYAKTFAHSVDYAKKALIVLDSEFANEEDYLKVRFAIQFNLIPRIIRAKFSIGIKDWHEAEPAEIDEAFNFFMPSVLEACEDYDLHEQSLVALVREGLYYRNYAQVEANVQFIKTLSGNKVHGCLYSVIRDEVLEYHYPVNTRNEAQFNFMVGYHIRKLRETLGLSCQELAHRISFDQFLIEKIECGKEDEECIVLIFKMSDDFDVSPNYFGCEPYDIRVPDSLPRVNRGTRYILEVMKRLAPEEQEYLLEEITNVLKIGREKRKKRKKNK